MGTAPVATPNTENNGQPPQNPAASTPPQNPPVRLYTEDELKERLKQARKEEKDKLYGDVEHHKKRADGLSGDIAKLTQELEALKTPSPNNPNPQQNTQDQNALLSQIDGLKKQLETVNLDMGKKLEEAITKVQQDQEALYQKRLVAAHIQTQIDAAGGKIIPELVSGNSIEEVNASVQKAKERYQAIYEAAKAEVAPGQLPRPVQPGNTNTRTPNSENNDLEVETLSVKDMRNLSDADFEKQQRAIKEKTLAQFGYGQGSTK